MSGLVGAPQPEKLRGRALWFLPLPAISSAVALAVVSGGNLLRSLLLTMAFWILSLPLLGSLEGGLLAIMLFEPMRGFFRRAQFIFTDFTPSDPIHLITPLVTILAFSVLIWIRRERMLIADPLGKPVAILGGIFFLQIFNPFQGSVYVGLSGALFIILPMAWFYFGRYMQSGFIHSAMMVIVIMGLFCSMHGFYQLFFGFPAFEQYWIAHTDHYESIAVGHIQRALATFNSAEEWARYVQYGGVIAFGHLVGRKQKFTRLIWLAISIAFVVIILFTGQRTAIFGLGLGCVSLILASADSMLGVAKRLVLISIPALVVLALVKPPSDSDMWEKDKDDKVGTMLSHSARGTFQPTKEASLAARFEIWGHLLANSLPSRPFGVGLGVGTVAAARNATTEEELYPIDSFIAVLIIGSSIPAAILFLYILFRAMSLAVRSFKAADPESDIGIARRIAVGIIPMLILNSFFGLTFTIYSAAPIAWMLIGWVCAETARDSAKAGQLTSN